MPGDGRYLIPGLWDMHVHLRGDRLNPVLHMVEDNAALLDLFLPNGVTGHPGLARSESKQRRRAGKVADLVMLRSNPLESIRHTQEIEAVFKVKQKRRPFIGVAALYPYNEVCSASLLLETVTPGRICFPVDR